MFFAEKIAKITDCYSSNLREISIGIFKKTEQKIFEHIIRIHFSLVITNIQMKMWMKILKEYLVFNILLYSE
jgi:hypothetical protein